MGVPECTPACNNVECAYDGGDCGVEEIIEMCLPLHTAMGQTLGKLPSRNATAAASLSSLSALQTPTEIALQAAMSEVYGTVSCTADSASCAVVEHVPVGLQLMVSPFGLALDETSNAMVLKTTLEYRVQWSDARLMTAPCSGMLPELLSVTEATSAQDLLEIERHKAMQWMPLLSVSSQSSSSVKRAAFVLGESLPWLDNAHKPTAYADSTSCPNCAVYLQKSEVTWDIGSEAWGHYRKFPFDTHEITLTVSVGGGNLYTCETALRGAEWQLATLPDSNDGWNVFLLPGTREWLVNEDMRGWSMAHGRHDDGGLDPSVCQITLRIRRNALIFFTKQILVSMLIVCSGMLSLLVHPQEHTGDRIAHLMLAVLIIVVNYQVDLNIGKLQYLIWWDKFNLTQLIVLLGALAQTIYAHHLCTRQRESQAVVLDRHVYFLLQCGCYPVLIMGLGMMGVMTDETGALLLMLVGVPVVLIAGVGFILRRRQALAALREDALATLSAIDAEADAARFKAALRDAFDAYDIDHDGAMDFDALRTFMRAVYPSAESRVFSRALHALRGFFEVGEDQLPFESFAEGINSAIEILGYPQRPERRSRSNLLGLGLRVKVKSARRKEEYDDDGAKSAPPSVTV